MKKRINQIKGKRLVRGGDTNTLTHNEILVTETSNGVSLKERTRDGIVEINYKDVNVADIFISIDVINSYHGNGGIKMMGKNYKIYGEQSLFSIYENTSIVLLNGGINEELSTPKKCDLIIQVNDYFNSRVEYNHHILTDTHVLNYYLNASNMPVKEFEEIIKEGTSSFTDSFKNTIFYKLKDYVICITKDYPRQLIIQN